MLVRAEAKALSLRLVADAINQEGGDRAASLRVAEQYVNAFSNIAKEVITFFTLLTPLTFQKQITNVIFLFL